MNREYRGMKVVEPKISKGESDRRKKSLKRRIPSFNNKSCFKMKLLMAVGSLIHDMGKMRAEGVTFTDIIHVIYEAVVAALVKGGHSGKIEFPFGKAFQIDPAYLKKLERIAAAHMALVKKYKAGSAKCLGKAKGRCQNPRCRRKTLKKWPGALGETYLLCSRCGWTNRPTVF